MIRLILFVALGISSFGRTAAQCPTGDVMLSTQAAVDNFPAGCAVISGNLTVSAGAITDLSPLKDITEVTGRVLLFDLPQLGSLAGLDGLTTVGQSLRVSRCDGLTDLTGLGGLSSATSFLEFDNNAGLTSVDGVGGSMTLDGRLIIEDNPLLQNLNGLAGLTQIGSSTLELSDNASLVDISGLDGIDPASIVNLIVVGNTALGTCDVTVVCDYLADADNPATVSGNAVGCTSRPEVETSCGPLPVRWVGFSATARKADNVLRWRAEATGAPARFSVSRSPDGRTWTAIGTTPATPGTEDYAYTDAGAPSVAYYRLAYREAGDHVDHSPTVVVRRADHAAPQVFPNPARGHLRVSPGEQVETLSLYRTTGQLVRTAGGAEMDLTGVRRGAYYLRIRSEGASVVRQVMIE